MMPFLIRLLASLFACSFIGFFWWFARSSFYLGPPPYPVLGPLLLDLTMGSGALLLVALVWKTP